MVDIRGVGDHLKALHFHSKIITKTIARHHIILIIVHCGVERSHSRSRLWVDNLGRKILAATAAAETMGAPPVTLRACHLALIVNPPGVSSRIQEKCSRRVCHQLLLPNLLGWLKMWMQAPATNNTLLRNLCGSDLPRSWHGRLPLNKLIGKSSWAAKDQGCKSGNRMGHRISRRVASYREPGHRLTSDLGSM